MKNIIVFTLLSLMEILFCENLMKLCYLESIRSISIGVKT